MGNPESGESAAAVEFVVCVCEGDDSGPEVKKEDGRAIKTTPNRDTNEAI